MTMTEHTCPEHDILQTAMTASEKTHTDRINLADRFGT